MLGKDPETIESALRSVSFASVCSFYTFSRILLIVPQTMANEESARDNWPGSFHYVPSLPPANAIVFNPGRPSIGRLLALLCSGLNLKSKVLGAFTPNCLRMPVETISNLAVMLTARSCKNPFKVHRMITERCGRGRKISGYFGTCGYSNTTIKRKEKEHQMYYVRYYSK